MVVSIRENKKICLVLTSLKGAVFFYYYLEIDFLVVSNKGSDIYLLLLISWKNIDPSRSYCWSKVSAEV